MSVYHQPHKKELVMSWKTNAFWRLSKKGSAMVLGCGLLLSAGATESIDFSFEAPVIKKTGKSFAAKNFITPNARQEVSSIDLPATMPFAEKPGHPVLPMKTVRVVLPKGHVMKGITVIPGKEQALSGTYNLEYQALPTFSDTAGAADVGPDKAVYTSRNPFPGVFYNHVMTQVKNGVKIVFVNIYPVQYVPVTGEVFYYPNLRVKVETEVDPAAKNEESMSPVDLSEIMTVVDNAATIETYGLSREMVKIDDIIRVPLLLTQHPYVIITDSTLAGAFASLANHKTRKGLNAAIYTTSWIYGRFSGTRPAGGTDNQTRIRNFIKYAHDSLGTRWVLLGGDESVIPHRGCKGQVNSSSGLITDNDLACDLYYACLDGTWDNNANGIYGESTDGTGGGEVDLLSDVSVGRAPVQTMAEANNFVNKTLKFETSYHKKSALFSGTKLDNSTWGCTHKDSVAPLFPAGWLLSRLYERTGTCNTTSIVGALNADTMTLWNSAGHGNTGSFSNITRTNVDALTNQRPLFVYTWACYTASFDNRLTDGSYETNDCIAEHFVNNATGAFAYVGNSRYGWYYSGSYSGPSHVFDKSFYSALFVSNIKNEGRTLAASKENLIGTVGATGPHRWVYFELNLLGDPETSIDVQPVCYSNLPSPAISFIGTEFYTVSGVDYIRYRFQVANYSSFPNDLFAPAPTLPACGSNTNSSRTWVDIYNNKNARLYGFCALGSSSNLTQLWVAFRKGDAPADSIYIKMDDRLCGTTYTSNKIALQTAAPLPAFSTTYTGATTRGYWFVAPQGFAITGLKVPDEAGAGLQNVQIVKFNSGVTPPTYPTVTNAFTSLYRSVGTPSSTMLNVYIPVAAGDVIGILGATGNSSMMYSSYGAGNFSSQVQGSTVVFKRLGMQFNLATTAAKDLWTENSMLGRVMFRYTK
jgi:hypothetical protein